MMDLQEVINNKLKSERAENMKTSEQLTHGMIEMRVFKDGNAWAFVLPDFVNLQVSESFWIDNGCDMHTAIEDIYETLTATPEE